MCVSNNKTSFPSTILMAAMELEVKPLLSQLRLASPRNPRTYDGEVNGYPIRLVVTGVGMESARTAALWVARQKPDRVVSLGFAGGISNRLAAGDLFIPTEVRNLAGKNFPLSSRMHLPAQKISTGVLLTVESIVQTREDKEKLSSFGDAVDMETFVIAEVMHEGKIPFWSIRAISDAVHETLPLDFSPAIQDGEVLVGKAIGLMLKKPLRIPRVLGLGLRSGKIARQLCSLVLSLLLKQGSGA